MKAGELLKFSDGKKHWSKYWFEIRSTLLLCHKSKVSINLMFTLFNCIVQVHVNRRPKMSVELNKWCKLTCIKEEQYCFEVSKIL